jgi:hypothetical protein
MATKKQVPQTIVSNNTLTVEAFKPTPEMMTAVGQIAAACEANAKALGVLAERIAGPADHRIGMRFEGVQ